MRRGRGGRQGCRARGGGRNGFSVDLFSSNSRSSRHRRSHGGHYTNPIHQTSAPAWLPLCILEPTAGRTSLSRIEDRGPR